jgi:hypothetical protein
LDLKDPSAVWTILGLVEKADTLIEGLRPGVMYPAGDHALKLRELLQLDVSADCLGKPLLVYYRYSVSHLSLLYWLYDTLTKQI